MYMIEHVYDVDGGFGDAIERSDIIGIVETKKEAEEYRDKYNNPEVYSKPYAELLCHEIRIKEISKADINVNPFENDEYFNSEIRRYKERIFIDKYELIDELICFFDENCDSYEYFDEDTTREIYKRKFDDMEFICQLMSKFADIVILDAEYEDEEKDELVIAKAKQLYKSLKFRKDYLEEKER